VREQRFALWASQLLPLTTSAYNIKEYDADADILDNGRKLDSKNSHTGLTADRKRPFGTMIRQYSS